MKKKLFRALRNRSRSALELSYKTETNEVDKMEKKTMRRRRQTAARRSRTALALILATVAVCFNAQALEPQRRASGGAASKHEQASAYLGEAFEAYNAKDYATALAKCGAALALEETKAAQDLMKMCKDALEKDPTKRPSNAASEWAKDYDAGALKSVRIDEITYNFRCCPSGTFTMGSPENEEGRGGRDGAEQGSAQERQRRVTLTKFWMLETEVTVGMWRSFVKATNYQMGSGTGGGGMYGVTEDGTMLLNPKYTWENPGYPQTARHPVVGVDWPGAVAFCEWLARETGLPVRLPTEAEWEYACRAGTTTAYSFGNDARSLTKYDNVYDSKTPPPGYDVASASAEMERLYLPVDGYKAPAPVKNFRSNNWNLFDMHGNVTEWCYDGFGNYDAQPQKDPVGADQRLRVLRGGAWNKLPADCRSAMRFYGLPENKSVSNGFRVVIGRKIKESDKVLPVAVAPVTAPVPAAPIAVAPAPAPVPVAPAPGAPTPKAAGDWTGKHAAGTPKSLEIAGATYNFRYCPPGTFQMGSPESEEGRGGDDTQHRVTLTRGFWMLETEVTQALWESVMNANPVSGSDWQGPKKPVVNVSWEECQKFIDTLNSLGIAPAGLKFRLPTEAEWEYACRAGTSGPYAGSSLDSLGWHADNSDGHIHDVGEKEPNDWGLRDMHGNVCEWCSDWFDFDTYDAASQTDPKGPPKGSARVLRGGGWYLNALRCRSAHRGNDDPTDGQYGYGFRIALGRALPGAASGSALDAERPQNPAPAPVPAPPKAAGDWTGKHAAGTPKSLEIAGATYNFRYCPPGTFQMGSPESEPDHRRWETLHQVTLTQGFWTVETEVTQALWESVMGENPVIVGKGRKKPVGEVNWEDCQKFVEKLNASGYAPRGLTFRLPTEAEWEYACRAGTSGPYAGSSLDSLGWYADNTDGEVLDVGEKDANAWGLYDMHGGVREWCLDWFAFDTYDEISQTDPTGPREGEERILRGGDRHSQAKYCRSAFRGNENPLRRDSDNGLRLVIGREVETYPAPVPVDASAVVRNASIVWPETASAGTAKALEIAGATCNFRYCPAGTFTMGSPESEPERLSNETQRKVTLTRGFWTMETEVTQALWESVMGENPVIVGKGRKKPVGGVNWLDCQEFIAKLNSGGYAPRGLQFRLPTEAEWEYACRAGTSGPYAGSNLDSLGWYADNTDDEYYDVGEKAPNAWGLLDMHGGVEEWCWDWYEYGASDEGARTNPTGASEGAERVLRGGCRYSQAQFCRSAYRSNMNPLERYDGNGLRLVLGGEIKTSAAPAPVPAAPVAVAPAPAPAPVPAPAKAAGDWTGKHAAGTPKSLEIAGATYNFRYCPPGTFQMGSPATEVGREARETQRRVTLTKGFWIMETETTVGMWRSFVKATNYKMGSDVGLGYDLATGKYGPNSSYTWENPGFEQGGEQADARPVTQVDWNGAVAFCEWLAKETGLPVRLPTEAEWEYACRAGTTTAYFFGNAPEDLTEYGNVADKSAKTKFPHWGWATSNDDGYAFTAPVKSFKPNAWGLYDMHGNVWEWCLDYYAEEPDATSLVDPTGPTAGARRVLRGGSWTGAPRRCRAAYSASDAPTLRNGGNGFRVVIGGEIKTSAAPAPVPAAPVAVAPVAPLAETCVPIGVPVAIPAPAPGAFQWLERAAKAGNVDGLRAIFLFYDGENPEIAGAALEKFATRPDCKDAPAKLALAVAYAYGYGVEQDAKKAFALFKELEEELEECFPAGPFHEALLLALALCYERGFGVAVDVSKTIELYEKGLALGYPTATANYGWCCANGRGVAKNTAEALRYYRRASDLGETGASCNLGSCYENGAYGLAKDAKKAFELYKKAADAGDPRGMREVARCYENGVGVGRSATEAAKWRERAGNAPAFFIEPIPGAENLAPPQGLRLNDVGLFVGRRVPPQPICDAMPADFPLLKPLEPVAAPATR